MNTINQGFKLDTLSEKDALRLSHVYEEYADLVSRIDYESILRKELAENKRFSLYEHSDEVIMLFNHGIRGESKLHLGFPFPLMSFDLCIPVNHLKMDVFIRGEPIRKVQAEAVKSISKEYKQNNSGLSRIVNDIGAQTQRVVYLDPYEFIGDSYIGLYFLDSVKHHLKIPESQVYSTQHQHLNAAVPAQNYVMDDIIDFLMPGDLIVAPDLIDTHHFRTLRLIESLKGKEVNILLPGRGMLLEISDEEVKTHHAGGPDVLLKNKNIEDYMAECLEAFGIPGLAKYDSRQSDGTSRFFVNPFASAELRYISPELVFQTQKELFDANKNTELCLIAGYHKNQLHTDWLNRFLTLLKDNGCMRRVSINYYTHLTELAEHLKEKECGAILTADTSVAHVANRLGYPNVSTHNPIWWDAGSLQSLSGSSPAGFARYANTQIPVINDAYNSEEIRATAKLLAKALMFFQQPYVKQKKAYETANVSWMDELYHPERIIYGIKANPRGGFLRSAAVKVGARYKMEALE